MSKLRTPENMFVSDMIGKYLVDRNGNSITIESIYNEIKNIELHSNCPQCVVNQFDNARNLYLYSFYNYDFCMIARIALVISLELAFKERALTEGYDLNEYKGLQRLSNLTIDKGWLNIEDLPGIKSDLKNIDDFKLLINFFKNTRNELSHGSEMLYPPLLSEFICIQRIINLLFK